MALTRIEKSARAIAIWDQEVPGYTPYNDGEKTARYYLEEYWGSLPIERKRRYRQMARAALSTAFAEEATPAMVKAARFPFSKNSVENAQMDWPNAPAFQAGESLARSFWRHLADAVLEEGRKEF